MTGVRRTASALAALVWLVASCGAAGTSRDGTPSPGLGLETVATGLESPVHLTSPPTDPRLFIVEQRGRIRIVENGRLLPEPFLDITDRVRSGGERGLLSVAFHPRYAQNGWFFVDYTDRNGNTHIERYSVTRDPDRADPASAKLLLEIDQPYANHNGGLVTFGPDGMLWIGMGDGGSGGDPHRNGQNRSALLAKLLRIDVDHGDPYAIPPDNPYAHGGGRPEIWAIGLRNPWRFSFDRASGLLYIADVGQDRWEEIDVAPMRTAGLDYGWNVMEGRHPFSRETPGGAPANRIVPAYEYGHSAGCSVTGGFVYRGRRIPSIVGLYFFADYCEGWVASLRYDGHQAVDVRRWDLGERRDITSFGEDAAGELYVLSQDGQVDRLVSRP